MKAITAVLGSAFALLAATSAMAQTAYDDAVCRQWASQYANWAQAQANSNAVGSTLGGALLGAGIGAIAGGGRGGSAGCRQSGVVECLQLLHVDPPAGSPATGLGHAGAEWLDDPAAMALMPSAPPGPCRCGDPRGRPSGD